MQKQKNNQGAAIIIVLGVLALLAVMGTAFTVDMRLEQKAAKNYSDNVKARLLAKAGIEKAIAALRKYASENASFQYVGATVGVDDYNSFIKDPTAGTNRWYAYDNTLAGGLGRYDVYVIDCASQIYVNLPSMENTLNNLGTVLGVGSVGTSIKNYLVSNPDGFITKESLETVLSLSDYETIKNYVCVNTWVDPDVIDPDSGTLAKEPRAPVNVNTASSEVLRAVLAGLSDGTNSITAAEPANVASDIISRRPYECWNDFYYYIATSLSAIADFYVIEANCNPNSDLMGFNPNKSWGELRGATLVDKQSLGATNTTELCFNSGGYFDIESIGRVYDTAGRLLAKKKLQATVKIFDIWRQTTQAQFENTADGATKAVDAVPLPIVQTYPEFDPGNQATTNSGNITAATWDGQVALATNTFATGGAIFRSSFSEDNDNTANEADSDTGDTGTTDLDESTVIPTTLIGDLFPDGYFISGPEYLNYPAAGNMSDDGTIEMWVKPGYTSAGEHYFFYFENGGNYIRLRDDGGGNLEFAISDGTVGDEPAASTVGISWSSNPYLWHHIAGSWTESGAPGVVPRIQVFADGAPGSANTGLVGFNIDTSAGTIWIGSDANPNTKAAEATLDEIRIQNIESSPAYPDCYYVPPASSDAIFTSSQLNLTQTVYFGTITWTEFLPVDSTEIANADLEVQVKVDTGSWGPASDNDGDGTDGIDNPALANTITTDGSTIQYRVKFQADVGTSGKLKDTPVFDDITITYLPKAQVVSWQEDSTRDSL